MLSKLFVLFVKILLWILGARRELERGIIESKGTLVLLTMVQQEKISFIRFDDKWSNVKRTEFRTVLCPTPGTPLPTYTVFSCGPRFYLLPHLSKRNGVA